MIAFEKYQGAGNDFILIDQRQEQWLHREDTQLIKQLCDRHFGIGADGLILLQNHSGYDFEMVYFNSDGRESTMCGNGGRCIAAFARDLGLHGESYQFLAIDGPHKAIIRRQADSALYWVELEMKPVLEIKMHDQAYILDTGSPHFVQFVSATKELDMLEEGRAVRYSPPFREKGINVNFASINGKKLNIRTYERGVESETLACGTGITAAAIAGSLKLGLPAGPVEIQVTALGGDLTVRMQKHADGRYTDIWLCGPAAKVFSGIVDLEHLTMGPE